MDWRLLPGEPDEGGINKGDIDESGTLSVAEGKGLETATHAGL